MGCSGAIFVDADGDGEWRSAHEYAKRIIKKSSTQLTAIVAALEPFDDAVATQTALLLHNGGAAPIELLDRELLSRASAATKRGFMAYVTAWRANEIARAK